MPRIRLPERRPLQPLQFNQPKDFTDLIYQTQSQPSALAVGAQTGLQVGTGLAKDYIKKRQDLAQLMALGKKAGLEESTLQDLGRRPETMTAAISALTQKGLAEQLKTPTEREAQGLELEKTRAEIENLRRKKQYAIPQYDTKGNIIGYSELPEGFTPFSGTKPSATPPAGKPKQVGVTPEGKSVVFDPTKQTNIVNGEEYTGTILPVAVGTEEQRRQALVQGAKTSINEIRNSLTPQVLSELKAIRFSPGKVYGQLASREAKMLYINLSEAIANELYLKTGLLQIQMS